MPGVDLTKPKAMWSKMTFSTKGISIESNERPSNAAATRGKKIGTKNHLIILLGTGPLGTGLWGQVLWEQVLWGQVLWGQVLWGQVLWGQVLWGQNLPSHFKPVPLAYNST